MELNNIVMRVLEPRPIAGIWGQDPNGQNWGSELTDMGSISAVSFTCCVTLRVT